MFQSSTTTPSSPAVAASTSPSSSSSSSSTSIMQRHRLLLRSSSPVAGKAAAASAVPTLSTTSLDDVAAELIEQLNILTRRVKYDDPTLTIIEPITAVPDYYGWNLLEQDDGQESFQSLLRALRKKGMRATTSTTRKRIKNNCTIRKVVLRCFAEPDIQSMLKAIESIPTIQELIITDDLEEDYSSKSTGRSTSRSTAESSRKRRRSSVGGSTSNSGQYINIDDLTNLLKAVHTTVPERTDTDDDDDDDDNNTVDDDDDGNVDDYNNYIRDQIIENYYSSITNSQSTSPLHHHNNEGFSPLHQEEEEEEEDDDEDHLQHQVEQKQATTSQSEVPTTTSSSVIKNGWKVIDVRIRIHVKNERQIQRFAIEGLRTNIESLTYINLHFLPRCSIATPTIEFDSIFTALSTPFDSTTTSTSTSTSSISKNNLTHLEIKLGYDHNPYCRPMVTISSLSQLLLSTTFTNSNLQTITLQNFGVSSYHLHMIAELLQLKHTQQTEQLQQQGDCHLITPYRSNNKNSKSGLSLTPPNCDCVSALKTLHIVGSLPSSFTDSSLRSVCASVQAIVDKKLQSIDTDEDNTVSSTIKHQASSTVTLIDHSQFLFDQIQHVRLGTIDQIQNIRRSLAFTDDDDITLWAPPKKKRREIEPIIDDLLFESSAAVPCTTETTRTISSSSSSSLTNTSERQFYSYHQQIQHSMRLLRILKQVLYNKHEQQQYQAIHDRTNSTNLMFHAICLANKNFISKNSGFRCADAAAAVVVNDHYWDANDDDDDDDADIDGEFTLSLLFDLIRRNPAILISSSSTSNGYTSSA